MVRVAFILTGGTLGHTSVEWQNGAGEGQFVKHHKVPLQDAFISVSPRAGAEAAGSNLLKETWCPCASIV